MRSTLAALCAIALLAGCKRERSFDERYDAINKQVDQSAREIDAEMAKRASDATQLPSDTAATQPADGTRPSP